MDGDKETAECRGEMSIVLLLCFANRLRRSYTRTGIALIQMTLCDIRHRQ